MSFDLFLISICEGDLKLFSQSIKNEFVNKSFKHNDKKYGFIKAEILSKHGHKNLRPLHLACDRGYVHIVEKLILSDSDIEACSKIGNKPIHIASSRGHWEIVGMLIKRGCIINSLNDQKLSALHLAAEGDHLKSAKILLLEGIEIEETNKTKLTPLEVAEYHGSTAVATAIQEWLKLNKLLKCIHQGRFQGILKHPGFRKYYVNNDICIEEIINYLKKLDRYKSVEQFVKEIRFYHYIRIHQNDYWLTRVDIESVNTIFDQDGALEYCLNYEDLCPYVCMNLVQLIVNMEKMEVIFRKIITILEKFSNKSIVGLIKKRQEYVKIKIKAFWNRLHLAVSDDRCDLIEYLLIKQLASINATDELGNTPLFLACIYGRMECAKLLLLYGADINTKNKYGQNLLQVAIENGMESLILPILDQITTIDSCDSLGHTILNVAIKFGSEEFCEMLIEKCKNTDNKILNPAALTLLSQQRNDNILLSLSLKENTASLCLKVKGYIPKTLILKMSQEALQIVDESSNSLLHLAAWNLSSETCRGLIDRGVDVHLKNIYGDTPLHEVINRYLFDNKKTIEDSHLRTISVLIQGGADLNIRNGHEETPLQLALQFINERLVKEMTENAKNIILEMSDLESILSSQRFELVTDIVPKIDPECSIKLITVDLIERYVGELDSCSLQILIDNTSTGTRKSILKRFLLSENAACNKLFLIPSFLKYEEIVSDILNGETVFTHCIKYANISFYQKILSSEYASFFIDKKNKQKQSPLQISLEKGNLILAQIILVDCKEYDEEDNDGNTPFRILLRKWSTSEKKEDMRLVKQLAKMFISKGISLNSVNSEGKMVLEECNNISLRKKLLRYYNKNNLKKEDPDNL